MPITVKEHYLPNKLKTIYHKNNSTPIVCIQLFFKIGSIWETEHEAGFSHFLEHLIFKSTQKYPDNKIMERVTELGGSINAYTEYYSTCVFITIPSRYLADGLELLSQMAMHVNFSDKDFTTEKRVVLEEFKQIRNDPEDYFLEEIPKRYFTNNPFSKQIIGSMNILKKSTADDLRKFYKSYYCPDNSFLVVTGDFEEDFLLKQISTYFSDWEGTSRPKISVVDELPSNMADYTPIKQTGKNDILAFIVPELPETDPDVHALNLAVSIFCVGKNSRLSERLINNEKIVDHFKAHSFSGIHKGISIIQAVPSVKSDPELIIKGFIEEYLRLNRLGVSLNELELKRKEYLNSYRVSFEYIENVAGNLGGDELTTGYKAFLEYSETIRTVSIEQIKLVIKKYLKPELLQVYHLTNNPIKGKNILQKYLTPTKIFKTANDDFHIHLLPNNLKLILKRIRNKPCIGMSLTVNCSQLNETAETRGLNKITSLLMLYGNEKFNHEQFQQFSTENAISFAATTAKEYTSFNIKCFPESIADSLSALSSLISAPTFPEFHLNKFKDSLIGGIARSKEIPHVYALKKWKQLFYGKKSNMVSREGDVSDIKKFSRRKIFDWHKLHFGANNMTLSITGDFDFQAAIDFAERHLSKIKSYAVSTNKEIIINSSDKRFSNSSYKSDQSIIHLGAECCTARETKYNTAFHILSQIIGGDMSSRMFTELREKLGSAYSVGLDYDLLQNHGSFVASAIVDKEQKKESLKAIIDIFDDIRINSIPEAELNLYKNYLIGQMLSEQESVLSIARMLSALDILGYDYDYYLKREERINNVTRDTIHELAQRYFNPQNYYIHILN
ncbi:MAG: pitrilysin family protein [Candidatus Cloacimonetes bacterium]|nr:pitrilysin family protein [Candidatus Cloacimonadota bacterium]